MSCHSRPRAESPNCSLDESWTVGRLGRSECQAARLLASATATSAAAHLKLPRLLTTAGCCQFLLLVPVSNVILRECQNDFIRDKNLGESLRDVLKPHAHPQSQVLSIRLEAIASRVEAIAFLHVSYEY